MSYSQFSATKAITGGALIAKLTNDNNILITLFKQVAFDQNNKKGNFDYKNSLVFKLTDDEAGDIIRVIRINGKMSFFHTFEETKTNGQFNFYTIESKGDNPARSGFGLSVTRGEQTIKVGFSLGAAERFAEFLKFCLNKGFEASYQEDLQKTKEYLENKNKEKKTPTNKKVQKKVEENSEETENEPSEEGENIDF